MNNHSDIQKRLGAYCGGDLSAAEKAEIEAHLKSCTLCRIHLTEMETTLRLIKSTPEVEAPVWMKSRIMARLREEQATRRSWLQRFWFPLHTGMPVRVLALLIMCVSGYYLSRSVDTELKLAQQQKVQDLPAERATQAQPTPARVPSGAPAPLSMESPPPGHQIQRMESAPSSQPAPAPAAPASALPAVPAAAPQAVQPPYAAAPPAAKGISSGKAEVVKTPPAREFSNQLQDSATEAKSRAKRALESSRDTAAPAAESAAGAAAKPEFHRAVIRMNVSNPEQAPQLIRDAVNRSGGTIITDHATSQRRYLVRLPAGRQMELVERLQAFGTLTATPSPTPPGSSHSEITIQW